MSDGNPILEAVRGDLIPIYLHNRVEYVGQHLGLIFRYVEFGGFHSDDDAQIAVLQSADPDECDFAITVLDRYLAVFA